MDEQSAQYHGAETGFWWTRLSQSLFCRCKCRRGVQYCGFRAQWGRGRVHFIVRDAFQPTSYCSGGWMGVRCVCISLVTRDTDAAIAQLSVIRKDGLQAEASEWSGLGAFKSPLIGRADCSASANADRFPCYCNGHNSAMNFIRMRKSRVF